MREIWFKAKTVVDRRWVFGNLFLAENGECFIVRGDNFHSCEIYVDHETVCQFTGLTDSDGKKVFEGDIIRFTERNEGYEWTAQVEFGNPNGTYTWGWQLVWMGGEKPNPGILLWFDMEEGGAYSKVIGNIHDKEVQHE